MPHQGVNGYDELRPMSSGPTEEPLEVRPIESLGEELEDLNNSIGGLVHRRDIVRKEMAKRLNYISERTAKADDHYYTITRGEQEGMPEESIVDWDAMKARKERGY